MSYATKKKTKSRGGVKNIHWQTIFFHVLGPVAKVCGLNCQLSPKCNEVSSLFLRHETAACPCFRRFLLWPDRRNMMIFVYPIGNLIFASIFCHTSHKSKKLYLTITPTIKTKDCLLILQHLLCQPIADVHLDRKRH